MTDTRKTQAQLLDELRGLRARVAELEAHRDAHRTLIEAMDEALAVVDEEGVITFVNDRLCELLGYPREEIVGRPSADFHDEAGRKILKQQFARRKRGAADQYEVTLVDKDGRSVPVLVSPRPMFDADGRFVSAIAAITDLTARKQAEKALRAVRAELEERVGRRTAELAEVNEKLRREIAERSRAEEALHSSHAKLRATFDAIQEAICVVDLDFTVTDVNEDMLAAFDLPEKKSVLGRKCFEVFKGREDICPYCVVAEAFRTKAPQYRTSTPEDGALTAGRTYEIFAYPIVDEEGNLTGAVEFARDVTARKRAAEALEESEKRLRDIFEAAGNISFIMTDLAGTDAVILEFTPGAERIFGYSRDEAVGRRLAMLHLPEDAAAFPRVIETMRRKRKSLTHETTLVRKSGERFPAILTTHPIFDAEGDMTAVLGVSIDISGRKQAEEALRESEARLRAFWNATSDTLILIEPDGTIIAMNEAGAGRLGKTADQVLGRCLYELFPPDVAEFRKARHDEAARSGRPVHFEDQRAGMWFDSGVYPILDEQGKVTRLAIYARETTQRREAEEALRQKNITLREVMARVQDEKDEVGRGVVATIDKIVMPLLRDLARGLGPQQHRQINLLRASLEEISQPFADRLGREFAGLTATEIRICHFVRAGLASKEIAELEHISPATVSKHREHIRRKLGITNRKVNLATYLEGFMAGGLDG